MEFRIADTFTDSLARLSGDEQRAVKTTAFDLQLNPANPGMSLHRLDRARDRNFWSVRVSSDIRLIVHKSDTSFLLCYVDHHDRAYDWAERRRLETHPRTGAAQWVEIRETVREVFVPVYVQAELPLAPLPAPLLKPLFAGRSNEELLAYGVPAEWLNDVRHATEDTLLALSDHLPAEATEALLELATGGKPRVPTAPPVTTNPFDHPDAQRRFRVMSNIEELQRALDYPWEKWTVFLHPEQRQWVERDYAGPARVSGSAGTGKTIVALHRAAFLARAHPDARVLLTTFSDALASALHSKLRRLLDHEPRLAERIDVHSLNSIGLRLYRAHIGPATIASREMVREVVSEAARTVAGQRFSLHFLRTEWEQVVDAWQLSTWGEYRDVARLGRRTRLPEAQRALLWSIFERVRSALHERKLVTHAGSRLCSDPIGNHAARVPGLGATGQVFWNRARESGLLFDDDGVRPTCRWLRSKWMAVCGDWFVTLFSRVRRLSGSFDRRVSKWKWPSTNGRPSGRRSLSRNPAWDQGPQPIRLRRPSASRKSGWPRSIFYASWRPRASFQAMDSRHPLPALTTRQSLLRGAYRRLTGLPNVAATTIVFRSGISPAETW
ncbi:MAG: UvrD-helicase domain-containing protein [Candidatus Accumulibacter contiguus]|jgi:mRNA-degrading endonuclease RelE of RelBE toxin-antitoxin system